jgi:hypothetical protein
MSKNDYAQGLREDHARQLESLKKFDAYDFLQLIKAIAKSDCQKLNWHELSNMCNLQVRLGEPMSHEAVNHLLQMGDRRWNPTPGDMDELRKK